MITYTSELWVTFYWIRDLLGYSLWSFLPYGSHGPVKVDSPIKMVLFCGYVELIDAIQHDNDCLWRHVASLGNAICVLFWVEVASGMNCILDTGSAQEPTDDHRHTTWIHLICTALCGNRLTEAYWPERFWLYAWSTLWYFNIALQKGRFVGEDKIYCTW